MYDVTNLSLEDLLELLVEVSEEVKKRLTDPEEENRA